MLQIFILNFNFVRKHLMLEIHELQKIITSLYFFISFFLFSEKLIFLNQDIFK